MRITVVLDRHDFLRLGDHDEMEPLKQAMLDVAESHVGHLVSGISVFVEDRA